MLASTIESYNAYREFFSEEQQKAFDAFVILSSENNETFFQMCLAYQNDQKNNVKININEIDIL